MSTCAPRRELVAPGWALLLVALVVVTCGAVPPHVHADVSPGFYNGAHVLESLAARSGDVHAREASPAGLIDAPRNATLGAPERILAAPVVRRSDSRAPPTA